MTDLKNKACLEFDICIFGHYPSKSEGQVLGFEIVKKL
jgi:hypothetical protein